MSLWISSLMVMLVAAAPDKAEGPRAGDDPVLRALQDEVARYGKLTAGSLERPYYVSGAVNDTDHLEIGASFGAIVSDWRNGQRHATIDMRLGTPQLDNKNFSSAGGGVDFGALFAMHAGGSLPWDPNYDAVRQALWLDLDGQYKAAVEALARKRAYLRTNLVPDRPPDFGSAQVTEVVLPRVVLSVDEAKWRRILKAASAVFRSDPGIVTATATFSANAQNQCFASTDPVRDRFGDVTLKLVIRATAEAKDGMEVSAKVEALGRSEAQMPTEPQILQAARELLARLTKIAAAPVLAEEDYSGPVLFTGRAADWFFLKGIGEPLSHPREPLGKNRGARMIDRLGKHVAATLVTVRDDPTQKMWRGNALLGAFPVDDEGVVPEPITLVEKGILKTYYMSRVPTQKVAATNGHARGGGGSVGNLFVETDKGERRAALKRKLIELAKAKDEPYGVLVDDFMDGFSGGRQEMLQMMMQMMRAGEDSSEGDIRLPPPAVVYRILPDGREELVRGATFKAVSFQALKDIVALGDSPSLRSTTSEGQPVSVVAPAVLVGQLELKAPTEEFEKPPAIPRPSVEAVAGPGSF